MSIFANVGRKSTDRKAGRRRRGGKGEARPLLERLESRTLLTLPVVTGVSPGNGPTAGGTTVTITGTNLESAAWV